MVVLITSLIANLLAIPKVCLAEVGDRRREHSVQIWVEHYWTFQQSIGIFV
jgi:hypothetical protein